MGRIAYVSAERGDHLSPSVHMAAGGAPGGAGDSRATRAKCYECGGGGVVVQVSGPLAGMRRSTEPGLPPVTASWVSVRYPMNSCLPAGMAEGVKTNVTFPPP